MNKDSSLPFVITVKISNIYDNNDRYNIINNFRNKYLTDYLVRYIVFVNNSGGAYSARLYYNYYIYLSLLEY